MKTITVKDVIEDKLPDAGWEKFHFYIFRDAKFVFYVGKTTQHILDRLAQHLGLTYLAGSEVGRLMEFNAPASYRWRIDLVTKEECAPIIQKHFPWSHRFDLALAEQALILEYSPALNTALNPKPRGLPRRYTWRREAQMKEAHRKAFGGK